VRQIALRSGHRIVVGRLFRNHLQHVPVFDDTALFVEAEDVNPR
jgi:hypothetical protein